MATLKFNLTLPAGVSVRKLYLTDMERHPVPTKVRSQDYRLARVSSGWVELETDAPPPFIVRAFVGSALGELDVAIDNGGAGYAPARSAPHLLVEAIHSRLRRVDRRIDAAGLNAGDFPELRPDFLGAIVERIGDLPGKDKGHREGHFLEPNLQGNLSGAHGQLGGHFFGVESIGADNDGIEPGFLQLRELQQIGTRLGRPIAVCQNADPRDAPSFSDLHHLGQHADIEKRLSPVDPQGFQGMVSQLLQISLDFLSGHQPCSLQAAKIGAMSASGRALIGEQQVKIFELHTNIFCEICTAMPPKDSP